MIVTAIIHIQNNANQIIQCRAVLDTGSSSNFMTEDLAKELKLPREKFSIPIEAINNAQSNSNYLVKATISSRINGFSKTLSFLTVSTLGGLLPSEPIDRNRLEIPKHVRLADPKFDQPAPIDLLLSAGTTLSLLRQGQIKLNGPNEPDIILQDTKFGWIIGGNALSKGQSPANQSLRNYYASADKDLRNFWEMDDIQETKHLSKEEEDCERHFEENVARTPEGQYVVALPFNSRQSEIGNSRLLADRRFKSLLRKFKRNPEFERQYTAVMQEYLDLGHMSKLSEDSPEGEGFYLPHHAVIKESSLTTKLRVVFDGSAKTEDNPISLNDALMVGPTIQEDIFALLTRFLTHQYVLTGDIEKMYRQFLIRKEDRKYQRILWKDARGNQQTYELNTVTFGLSCAPYLAIRCIHQLAEDEKLQFPIASKIIKRDLYVDDLLTGTDTYEEAETLRNEISNLLSRGGLNLRQWASNEPGLLEGLPEGSVNLQLRTSNDTTIKTLGLHWNSANDSIVYTVKPIKELPKVTKRTMLSDVAKIFDPLGFLGPVVIKGRMILHKLWLEKSGWDDAIPLNILTEWKTYAAQLTQLNNVSFERRTIIPQAKNIQLHGFCDASEKGYGACIYVRSTDTDGKIQGRLLCAKYRVAPIKPATLPRLELCSAALLADLYVATKKAIHREINQTIFWSDSMVALHWINTPPHKLLVFAANRVAGIQEKTAGSEWRHVRSGDNPADHISRGLLPNEFLRISNWKTGPSWLSLEENLWPESHLIIPAEPPEMRKTHCFLATADHEKAGARISFFEKYSSIGKLRRLVAYALRFKRNNTFKGPLSATELDLANQRIIKTVQESAFPNEIKELQGDQVLSKNHKFKALDPFIDERGLLRVGGRLKNAFIPYSQKHPLLIPKGHHVTTLLIRNEHLTNYHAGAQTTLYALRRNYWLPDARQQVRKIIRACVTCVRANPPQSKYIMGDLPRIRVTEARPFYNVGVDYCGPFFVKEKKHRNRTRVKIWVSVFVCLVTKAVHLEAVTDLTTEGFMAALKRFIARRGRPKNIYSDNGSNFIGANREIKELYSFIQSSEHNKIVQENLVKQQITWHFMPPLSPHFGGLWEAGVKSFKHHLKRICDDLVTLEEFNTLIIEIEAILNSRPLTPISTDPNDLIVLTPGHFLVGDSLMSLPETNFETTPSNRLSSWEFIQKKQQEFWKRWHKEYLNEQNLRSKWTNGSHSIKEGTVVILRDDNLPPRQWSLGRVIQTYPGADGVIRAVRVKTATGEFNRNIRKLAPLFLDSNETRNT